MSSKLIEIFEDAKLINRIKNKLPYLFQLAELESSRVEKLGWELGLCVKGSSLLCLSINSERQMLKPRYQ